MGPIFFLLMLASIVGFFVGLFSPEKSLFWWSGERTRMKSAQIYLLSFCVCAYIVAHFAEKTTLENAKETAKNAPDTTNKQVEKVADVDTSTMKMPEGLKKFAKELKENAKNAPQETSQSLTYIPGLTAVDVYLNLTNKGFSKTLGNYGGGLEYFLEQKTEEHSLDVQIIGEADDKIERIRATATYYSGNDYEDAKNFLAFVAGVTYRGARPQEASNWVRANVGQRVSTTIGGVTFSLAGEGNSAFTKMLTIEPAP